jgi:hypothetical protein
MKRALSWLGLFAVVACTGWGLLAAAPLALGSSGVFGAGWVGVAALVVGCALMVAVATFWILGES